MNLFSSLFGKSESNPSTSKIDWVPLTQLAQLDDIIAQSSTEPVLIFKHSTRCGISRMVLKQFESAYDLEDKIAPYFLDLLQHRDISNAIADRFGVTHQSPQLLLIKGGKSIYNASHGEINDGNWRRVLEVG